MNITFDGDTESVLLVRVANMVNCWKAKLERAC